MGGPPRRRCRGRRQTGVRRCHVAAAAFKIERFVLAERVELTNDAQLLPVDEVPAAIQLLNPSPGVMDTMVEFAVGIEATGFEPNASVSGGGCARR